MSGRICSSSIDGSETCCDVRFGDGDTDRTTGGQAGDAKIFTVSEQDGQD